MNLTELQELWEIDSFIDEEALASESVKIPKLHSKYFKILTAENLKFKKLDTDYKRLYLRKYEHYLGNIDYDTLKELGWEPFLLKITKTEVDKYIEADDHIIELQLKLTLQKEKVKYLESIIQTLNNRSFHIGNAIDFIKFTNGMN